MLVTLNEMKDYLGIPLANTSSDTFLTENIQVISDSVEAYCGRKFEVANYVQTFYFDDYKTPQKELSTFHYPLVSITSVTQDGVAVPEYRAHYPTGKFTNKDWFFNYCGDVVEIQYSAGFASVPSPVKSVVYSLVEERYNKKKSGVSLNFGSDVQSISIPGTISVQFDYSLQSNERKNAFGTILGNYVNILDAYRSERVIVGSGKVAYVS